MACVCSTRRSAADLSPASGAPFPLLSLNALLLEKVVLKLEEKNYFRLQQTCRHLNELVRTSRKISINLKETYFLWISLDGLECIYLNDERWFLVNLEGLYGTRVTEFRWTGEEAAPLCKVLNKYRITCSELRIPRTECTVEEYATLVNVIKPLKVNLERDGSHLYEAVLRTKGIRGMIVCLEQEDVPLVAPKLLSQLEEVEIIVKHSTDQYFLLRTFLEYIQIETLPKLKKCELHAWGDFYLPTKNELKEHLHGFKLTKVEIDEEKDRISALVKMPSHYPRESSSKILVDGYDYTVACIHYSAVEDD